LDICLKYSDTNKISEESLLRGYKTINSEEKIGIDEIEKLAIKN
jgi:hypothetical protein